MLTDMCLVTPSIPHQNVVQVNLHTLWVERLVCQTKCTLPCMMWRWIVWQSEEWGPLAFILLLEGGGGKRGRRGRGGEGEGEGKGGKGDGEGGGRGRDMCK